MVSEYFEAVRAYTYYLGNDVFRLIGESGMTQAAHEELRRKQVAVQKLFETLLIFCGPDLLTAATRFGSWMDNEIRGLPLAGSAPDKLPAAHPLVQSMNIGGTLRVEMVNPVRGELGLEPLEHLTTRPTPNMYGR